MLDTVQDLSADIFKRVLLLILPQTRQRAALNIFRVGPLRRGVCFRALDSSLRILDFVMDATCNEDSRLPLNELEKLNIGNMHSPKYHTCHLGNHSLYTSPYTLKHCQIISDTIAQDIERARSAKHYHPLFRLFATTHNTYILQALFGRSLTPSLSAKKDEDGAISSAYSLAISKIKSLIMVLNHVYQTCLTFHI